MIFFVGAGMSSYVAGEKWGWDGDNLNCKFFINRRKTEIRGYKIRKYKTYRKFFVVCFGCGRCVFLL